MTLDTSPSADSDGPTERVELHDADDVVRARHHVRDVATAAGFDLVSQTKLVTAVSELARNAVGYGGGGWATVQVVRPGGRTGIVVEVLDEGPGIADVQQAMTGGWSSGTGLGLGLPGSQRLVHEFELRSEPGHGTRVRIVMWRRRR